MAGRWRAVGAIAHAAAMTDEAVARTTSFRGHAFRCVPDNGPVELESLVSTDGENDRWNHPGEPTLYLALDPGVAIAEAGRHHEPAADAESCQRLLRLEVATDELLDLREPSTADALGVDGAPFTFLDRDRARQLASRIRREGSAKGLIVPSAAFLDDASRGNLVLFAERAGPVEGVVKDWEEIGRIDVGRAELRG